MKRTFSIQLTRSPKVRTLTRYPLVLSSDRSSLIVPLLLVLSLTIVLPSIYSKPKIAYECFLTQPHIFIINLIFIFSFNKTISLIQFPIIECCLFNICVSIHLCWWIDITITQHDSATECTRVMFPICNLNSL